MGSKEQVVCSPVSSTGSMHSRIVRLEPAYIAEQKEYITSHGRAAPDCCDRSLSEINCH